MEAETSRKIVLHPSLDPFYYSYNATQYPFFLPSASYFTYPTQHQTSYFPLSQPTFISPQTFTFASFPIQHKESSEFRCARHKYHNSNSELDGPFENRHLHLHSNLPDSRH